jgi:hypothetical protein
MSTRPQRLTQRLEKAWTGYADSVETLAKVWFGSIVKPFCVKRDFTFLTGNGDYWIGPRGKAPIESWEVPESDAELKELFTLLDAEVPGMATVSFGCLMPEFDGIDRIRAPQTNS